MTTRLCLETLVMMTLLLLRITMSALERIDALERAMRNIEARVARLETHASPRSDAAPNNLDCSALAPSSHLYIGLINDDEGARAERSRFGALINDDESAVLTDTPATGEPPGSICASPDRWDMLNRRIEMLEHACEGVRSEVAAARRSDESRAVDDGAASSLEARTAAPPLAGRLENAAARLEQNINIRGDPHEAPQPPPPPSTSAPGAAEEPRSSHSASLTAAV